MLIDKTEIKIIDNKSCQQCVSIYIRTHRAGESEADKIRWKNACNEAAEKLIDAGLDGTTVSNILRPAQALMDDKEFWLHLSDGLVMFLGEGFHKKFILPIKFENRVYLNSSFVTSPLYLYFKDRQRFFIFDISKGHNRFFEANRDSITPVEISDLVPSSIEDIPELDDAQESIQQHGNSIFHGQGSSKDAVDTKLNKYLKALSKGMQEIFVGEEVPLVLSGPEELVSLFRKFNDYSPTVDMFISGNNEDMNPFELHERAWICIEKEYLGERASVEQYIERFPIKEKMLTDYEDIKSAIENKNIEMLVVGDDFLSLEEGKVLKLNGIIQDVSKSGAKVEIADSQKLNQLDTDYLAIKYY